MEGHRELTKVRRVLLPFREDCLSAAFPVQPGIGGVALAKILINDSPRYQSADIFSATRVDGTDVTILLHSQAIRPDVILRIRPTDMTEDSCIMALVLKENVPLLMSKLADGEVPQLPERNTVPEELVNDAFAALSRSLQNLGRDKK